MTCCIDGVLLKFSLLASRIQYSGVTAAANVVVLMLVRFRCFVVSIGGVSTFLRERVAGRDEMRKREVK